MKDTFVWLGLCLLIGSALLAYLFLRHAVHTLIIVPFIEGIERSEPWALFLLAVAASILGSGVILWVVRSFNRPRKRPSDAP